MREVNAMCMFSQAVEHVSNTQIFARRSNGKQLLTYSMTYRAARALAMVLPLPVPPDGPEDVVRFVDLQAYPEFFSDLRSGFPIEVWLSRAALMSVETTSSTLVVHDVGSFEASFVPTLEDFDRLDERFRIPPDAMGEIPMYRDYGFAVFKLKPTTNESDVHPMALEFPQREPERVFFPTVHLHDGRVHKVAAFDHTLYCQLPTPPREGPPGWKRSDSLASEFVDVPRAEGLIEGNHYCWRRTLRGMLPNTDTWM
jgi:hypothetical protein